MLFERVEVLGYLKEKITKLKEECLEQLPYEHKTTTLDSNARCSLSYHQGYRDGVERSLAWVRMCYTTDRDRLQDEEDQMYLDHLRRRCLEANDMSKEDCIKYLKDKGLWKYPK
tara:strand:+ start:7150 stop:7491 length:342 start_codon:yes stop_codon:yes gene_type:complete